MSQSSKLGCRAVHLHFRQPRYPLGVGASTSILNPCIVVFVFTTPYTKVVSISGGRWRRSRDLPQPLLRHSTAQKDESPWIAPRCAINQVVLRCRTRYCRKEDIVAIASSTPSPLRAWEDHFPAMGTTAIPGAILDHFGNIQSDRHGLARYPYHLPGSTCLPSLT